MSGTNAPTPTAANASRISEWGTVVVSVIVLLIYGAAMGIAYLKSNENLLVLLLGVAATNFTTAVGFWLGSSYGSAKKTDKIASLATPPAPALGTVTTVTAPASVTTTTGATGPTGPNPS